MSSIDLIRMGLKNLFRRKARTILTTLGVIIGTAAIVTMLSLGFGMKATFQEQIESMGSVTTIDVYQSYGDGPYGMSSSGKSGTLDDKAIAQFKNIEGVKAVTPVIESYAKIVSGKYAVDMPLRGIYPEVMKDFDFEVKEGRLLQEGDGLNIVFGNQVLYNFRDQRYRNNYRYSPPKPDEKPKVNVLTDKLILTYDYSYGIKTPSLGADNTKKKPPKLFKVKGVGILKEGQRDSDYAAYMDINQLKKLMEENIRSQSEQNSGYMSNLREQLKYQRIMVKVKDMKYVKEVQSKIKDMGFQASSLNDISESMQKTSSTLQMILGGIGAISLLVAALGITNTMVMSIYERTREIGVMKVLGAALRDIKRLFLFESGMIGFFGGLAGIGASFMLSALLNTVGQRAGRGIFGMGGMGSKISIIPLWLVLSVIFFSTLVGLVSGYYPAKRAMKLSALEAIKNE